MTTLPTRFWRFPGLVLGLLMLRLAVPAAAVELDDVYRFLGPYRVTASAGLKIYFPESCAEAMPRIMGTLQFVRRRLATIFPDQKAFSATLLLTDHDDRESSSSDSQFDLVTMGAFEELGALSTRGYSLEERFSLRLAHTLILRSLGPAKMAFRRRIGLLSIPPWFILGLSHYYAFPMNAVYASRLYEMVRNGRLYSLDDLDTVSSRPTRVREEMTFQAQSLLEFLHAKAGPDSGAKLLHLIRSRPIQFDRLFREAFGMSLPEAFAAHARSMKEQCQAMDCDGAGLPPILDDHGGGGFYQSMRPLPDGNLIWASSARYQEEVYDLYRKVGKGKPRLIMRNIHPGLWVDPDSGTIFVGRYGISHLRQRRLSLWAIPQQGRPFALVQEVGSCKPLGIHQGRLFYLNMRAGISRLMSADPVKTGPGREEFRFPADQRPLDLALGGDGQALFFVLKEEGTSRLCRLPLPAMPGQQAEVLYSCPGTLRGLEHWGDRLYFAAEGDFRTVQLCALETLETATAPRLLQFTRLPGGVWDFKVADDGILATTLRNGQFWPIRLPLHPLQEGVASVPAPIAFGQASSTALPSSRYQQEYHQSFWLPRVNRDDQGAVFGVYSYRADRLDRSRIVVSPTYGFKSRNWGYLADIMQRFDLFKANLSQEDRVVRKSYLSNSYYERVRSTDLRFTYPFSLSTSLNFGGNLTHRGIAKFPERGGSTPTVGRDHSVYGQVYHRAIRTEPYWFLFPRKGRVVAASYRKGLDWLDGELKYDSMSLRWDEHFPLDAGYVLSLRTYAAEDDKEGDIRRPDDLNLGGSDFLRGYPGSVRYGDSLRAVSVHLSHELPLNIPRLRSLVHKEMIVGEVFWERGDVRLGGRRFEFLEDRGVEIRARGLVMRRVPVTIRWGVAWPNGGGPRHSYWGVDVSSLSDLVQ